MARKKTPEYKIQFGVGLINLANLVGGALILGQAFGIDGFKFGMFFLGLVILIFIYAFAIIMMKGDLL